MIWEHTVKDWERVIGVNLMGVAHGVRVFTPLMLKQEAPSHIINTASVAGMLSTQGMAADAAPVAGALTDPLPAGLSGGFPDRLASREEVVKCLDLVIAFYDRTEPSSPIPHLVRRIRRMVPMDFLQLMEDLAPSGLKEFRLLAGVPDAGKQRTKGETA